MRNIIDVHTHIYPAALAEKAVAAIGAFYGQTLMSEKGTSEDLIAKASAVGVKKIVVQSVATKKTQVTSINTFLAQESAACDMFVPFATLHPSMEPPEIAQEVCRIKELGFKGIKLHPDCQAFKIASDSCYKLLECLDDSLPILMHTGDKKRQFSNPYQMQEVAMQFKHLKFIAAHFGGYSEWEQAEGYIGIPNVYFDTSSSLAFLSPSRAKEIIEHLGSDRFMFGTDYPMWDYKGELNRLLQLRLSESDLTKILYTNAKTLLNI